MESCVKILDNAVVVIVPCYIRKTLHKFSDDSSRTQCDNFRIIRHLPPPHVVPDRTFAIANKRDSKEASTIGKAIGVSKFDDVAETS